MAPVRARLAFVFGKESRILQPVSPVLVAFSAILLTSVVDSTVGVLTSFASALAAAYFCFPPKFSFYISDPLNVAELGFFLLLAVIASKAVAVATRDDRATKSTSRRPKYYL